MLKVVRDANCCSLSWNNWQLRFEWKIDRWGHSFVRLPVPASPTSQAANQSILWSSIEGLPTDEWPASPVFQDLHVETIDDHCSEVQLLGQSGRNHYSGAIRYDGQQQAIDFDLAVRIQASLKGPMPLSSYHCFCTTHTQDANGEGTCQLESPVGEWGFRWYRQAGFPLLSLRKMAEAPQDQIQFMITDLDSLKWERRRATLRWHYRYAALRP